MVEAAPDVGVKVYRLVKLVPSVLTANTVPLPELPPPKVVPYSVLPDKANWENTLAPSLLVEKGAGEKICRLVKPVPLVFRANTVPELIPPPAFAVP